MGLASDIIRLAAAAVTLYTFYIGHIGDAFAVLAIILGTYAFKLRRSILIEPSRAADVWELALTLLFAVNAVFVALNLYNTPFLSVIDVPLHFLGGAFAGWWAYLTLHKNGAPALDKVRMALCIAGAAALLGIGWEVFEWAIDHTLGAWYVMPKAQPSLDDTMKDLTLDVIGGCIAGIALLRHRKGR